MFVVASEIRGKKSRMKSGTYYIGSFSSLNEAIKAALDNRYNKNVCLSEETNVREITVYKWGNGGILSHKPVFTILDETSKGWLMI
ncbi:MAG: hypothetical protein NC182_01825 [Prevotella sp.]|nr:hypothetical protein [Staphylococcus sp.]MCM1349922.1 hypothetical protein [Prevotella sp.]